MRKLIMKISTCLVAFVLLLSFPVNALAASGAVTYDGSAGKFVFAPGSDSSPTDLFSEFKSVMPGDTLTEQIVVKNSSSSGSDVRIYLRSMGGDEEMEDFLSKLTLTVQAESGETLFEAPASETAGLTDWNDLGLFAAGAETTLTLTLSVPAELGNAYQNLEGTVTWEFMAEEIPAESASAAPLVKTGDSNRIGLWVLALGISAACVAVILVSARRRKTGNR